MADLTGQEKINMKIIEGTVLFIVELVKKRIKVKKKKKTKDKKLINGLQPNTKGLPTSNTAMPEGK